MKVELLDPQVLVYAIHDFLAPEECRSFIVRSEAQGFTPAPLTTARGPVMAPEVRSNTRVMVDDHALAAGFWNRLQTMIPQTALDWGDEERTAIGVNERFRFYRYENGQKFARHYDGAFLRDTNEGSLLSFMVYLNDDFEGGETRFFSHSNKLRFAVRPRTGSALVFLHNQCHEGAPVTKGRKYVMRTDVMYRRQVHVLT